MFSFKWKRNDNINLFQSWKERKVIWRKIPGAKHDKYMNEILKDWSKWMFLNVTKTQFRYCHQYRKMSFNFVKQNLKLLTIFVELITFIFPKLCSFQKTFSSNYRSNLILFRSLFSENFVHIRTLLLKFSATICTRVMPFSKNTNLSFILTQIWFRLEQTDRLVKFCTPF